MVVYRQGGDDLVAGTSSFGIMKPCLPIMLARSWEQDLENLADESLGPLRQASEELKSHGIPSWGIYPANGKDLFFLVAGCQPWPVYQKQMDILSTQCADLVK